MRRRPRQLVGPRFVRKPSHHSRCGLYQRLKEIFYHSIIQQERKRNIRVPPQVKDVFVSTHEKESPQSSRVRDRASLG
ncbi:hypothetical protein YC2023_076587 [Brassica napus]